MNTATAAADLPRRIDMIMAVAAATTGNETITETLHDLTTIRYQLTEATTAAVVLARSEGMTWQAIGDALHITKQAAQQRYGSLA